MLTKKGLKSKYKGLLRQEKEIIGAAIVKVNLGVALPGDHKRAAEFLKGSNYLAKKGSLDSLIQYIHDDDMDASKVEADSKPLSLINESSKTDFIVDKEDSVVTEKVDLKKLGEIK